jgi:hypothetical protein
MLTAAGKLIALMMEAASTIATSLKFYQTTRRSNPEDSHHQNGLHCWRDLLLLTVPALALPKITIQTDRNLDGK